MNLMVWHKPPKEEIDGKSTSAVRYERTFTDGFADIERLGNPGWNWENYQKYSHKVERSVIDSEISCRHVSLNTEIGQVY